MIALETPDGKTVNIGYRNNALTLYKLSQLSIGAEIELDVKTSDLSYGANLYVDIGDDYLMSQLKVREFQLKEKQIAKQLALLDA